MAANAEIFFEHDQWGRNLAWSAGLHFAVAAAIVLYAWLAPSHSGTGWGAGGGGDAIELDGADIGRGEGASNQRFKMIKVSPSGDFGDDAAIGRVFVELRAKQIGKDPRSRRAIGDNCRGSLVATRLDAQNDHRGRRSKGLVRLRSRAADYPGCATS